MNKTWPLHRYFAISMAVLLSIISHSKSKDHGQFVNSTKHKDGLFPAVYDWMEPPHSDGTGYTLVEFYLMISGTPKFDEANEEITMEIELHLKWNDTRLTNLASRGKSTLATINPSLYGKIWTPDVYISILRKNILKPPLLPDGVEQMLVAQSGRVIYEARVNPVLDCDMVDMTWFPADVQKCDLHLVGRTSDSGLHLNWTSVKIKYLGKYDSLNYIVDYHHSVQHSDFNKLPGYVSGTMTFYFSRKMGYYILQTYLPSGLIVILTWLGLFIPLDGISERLSLSTTTLLTLTALFGSTSSNIPQVSYVKGIDVWMFACVLVVFLILTANIAILNVKKGRIGKDLLDKCRLLRVRTRIPKKKEDFQFSCLRRKKHKGGEDAPADRHLSSPGLEESENEDSSKLDDNLDLGDETLYLNAAKTIDSITRIVIITLYTVFTICYVVYMAKGDPEGNEIIKLKSSH